MIKLLGRCLANVTRRIVAARARGTMDIFGGVWRRAAWLAAVLSEHLSDQIRPLNPQSQEMKVWLDSQISSEPLKFLPKDIINHENLERISLKVTCIWPFLGNIYGQSLPSIHTID
jgi:hypothetical protein